MPQNSNHQYAPRISFSSSNQHNKDTFIQIKKVSTDFLSTSQQAELHFIAWWLTEDTDSSASSFIYSENYSTIYRVESIKPQTWQKMFQNRHNLYEKLFKNWDHRAGQCTLSPINTEYSFEYLYHEQRLKYFRSETKDNFVFVPTIRHITNLI